MKRLRTFFLLVGVLCITFSAFPQETKVTSSGTASKELRRTARRLHIPVEQLKKARRTLQEATDLAKQIKPFPVSQMFTLTQVWRQLHPSKVKEVTDSFVQELRSEAATAPDAKTYHRATSTAMSLMQSNEGLPEGVPNFEKTQQMLQSWPQPPEAAGEAATKFLRSLESNARQSALSSLVYTDPVKAKELLLKSGDSEGGYNYAMSGQIVQNLVNKGMTDEALALVNQTISDFNQHASDPKALQGYQSFAQSTARSLGSGSTNTIMAPLIAQLTNQAPSENCMSGTIKMKSGDKSVALSCTEYNVLNMIRGFSGMPQLTSSTLNSFPTLKSKVDQIGGIDDVYSNVATIMPNIPKMQGNMSASSASLPPGIMDSFPDGMPIPEGISTSGLGGSKPALDEMKLRTENRSKLLKEIKGKAESNPEFVKGKLREYAKGKNGINMLMSLAMTMSYADPDLGSLVLEVAKPLLSQVEPIQKRASVLQTLMQAYRQIEGEVDSDLMRDGFALADQLRGEQSKKSGAQAASGKVNPLGMLPPGFPAEAADEMEAYMEAMAMSGDMGMMGGMGMMPPYMLPGDEAEMEAYMEEMASSGYMDDIMSDPGYMEEMAASGGFMGDIGMMGAMMGGMPGGGGSADQLETFLVSEMARDNYEKAMDFAHSRKGEALKLTCLVTIAQSLCDPGY
jgi:hypothetical protein